MKLRSSASSRRPSNRIAFFSTRKFSSVFPPLSVQRWPQRIDLMNPPGRTTEEITVPQQIALLASMRAVHAAFSWFQIHENELRKLQLEVARIPAPPFEEAQRAKWLFDKFTGIGLEQIEIDEIGNVLAVLPGVDRELPATAIGAHLDTVFPPETEIEIHEERERICGPGVSDNAAGLIALLAIPMAMREAKIRPECDILFIGNVG